MGLNVQLGQLDVVRPDADDELGPFFVHEVVVQALTGGGGYGDTVADPYIVLAWVNDSRRLIRDASGQEVVSETQVTVPRVCPAIPLGSKVTLPPAFDDRESTVLAVNRQDPGPLPLPGHTVLAMQ